MSPVYHNMSSGHVQPSIGRRSEHCTPVSSTQDSLVALYNMSSSLIVPVLDLSTKDVMAVGEVANVVKAAAGEVRDLTESTKIQSDQIEADQDQDQGKDDTEKTDDDDDIDPDPETDPDELFPITFTIPDPVLNAAKTKKATKSLEQYISYTMYRGIADQTVTVKYCRTMAEVEREVTHFRGHKAIGFDMEWPYPAPKPPLPDIRQVSLIQIASQDRIMLAHIAMHKGTKPTDIIGPNLREILADKTVLKLGVNVGGDATRLEKYLKTPVKGCFELSHLYKLVQYGGQYPKLVDKRKISLADQCYNTLGVPLNKANSVRCSRWHLSLSNEQVVYAASDAYVGLMIFIQLDKARRAMNPRPPRPFILELSHGSIRLPKQKPIKQVEVSNTTVSTPTVAHAIEGSVGRPDIGTLNQAHIGPVQQVHTVTINQTHIRIVNERYTGIDNQGGYTGSANQAHTGTGRFRHEVGPTVVGIHTRKRIEEIAYKAPNLGVQFNDEPADLDNDWLEAILDDNELLNEELDEVDNQDKLPSVETEILSPNTSMKRKLAESDHHTPRQFLRGPSLDPLSTSFDGQLSDDIVFNPAKDDAHTSKYAGPSLVDDPTYNEPNGKPIHPARTRSNSTTSFSSSGSWWNEAVDWWENEERTMNMRVHGAI